MRKSIAAAAMAASLTVGGATGVALFTPALSGAAQTDDTVQTDTGQTTDVERPRLEDWLDEALTPLVSDGTIDEGQKTAVIDAVVANAPERPPRPGGEMRGDMAEAIAGALNMTTDELRQAHLDGKTLADLINEQGVDEQTVIDAIVATIEEHLDQAVENGRLTEEQAAELKANATERAQEMLSGEFPEGPHGPRGRFGEGPHGGPGGPFGPGFDDTSGS